MTNQQNFYKRLIEELRNRRVFRVSTVYVGISFALIEVSDILLPMLEAPAWSLKAIVILLAIGFPLAVTLAWMFQFTPEGVRRSPKSGEKQTTADKPLTSNSIIIALLVIIAMLLAFPRYKDTPTNHSVSMEAQVDSKSIAVLPFTPFADEREDEIFADGVHDDILTQLSKIADLKVISRTSVMQYKGTTKLIPDIAGELGVANVLEGSVRRAGDQIRIVAQLINAATDEHLWAETFDREYADIFSVQTEVAKKIAQAMKATLTPAEISSIEQKPTENLEAYSLFMQGKLLFESFTGQLTMVNLIHEAIPMYEQALKLDPGLLAANTGLVEAYVQLLNNAIGVSDENKAQAKKYLDQSLSIDPRHPDTHKALGLVAYYVDRDFDKAIDHFRNSIHGRPNDADVLGYMAAVVRRQGKFKDSQMYYQKAFAINPRSASLLYNAASTSMYMHAWEEEAMYIDMLIALEPEAVWWHAGKGYNLFQITGDLNVGISYLDSVQDGEYDFDLFEAYYYLLTYKNDWKRLRELLDDNDPALFYPFHFGYGLAERMFGNEQKALAHFDSLEVAARAQLSGAPDDVRALGYLANALLGKGDKAEAIKLATKATEIVPIEKDAMNGARALWVLCDINAVAKEKEATLSLLEKLSNIPSEISVHDLTYDPNYDFLRDEPRFQVVLENYENIYKQFN